MWRDLLEGAKDDRSPVAHLPAATSHYIGYAMLGIEEGKIGIESNTNHALSLKA